MPIFRKKADRIRGVAGSLEKTHVLVADATAGAGPGIARVLADAGASVTVAGHHSPTVDIELRNLEYAPSEASGLVINDTSPDHLAELVDSLTMPVDILVANPTVPSLDTDTGLGVRPVIALAKVVLAQMTARGHTGSIVFVGGIPTTNASTPANAFLTAEMEQLARDHAKDGIRINAVLTGEVAAGRRGQPGQSKISPLGRVSVHPVEVGKTVWFLANIELSSGITGSTLKIDRGASLVRPEW